MEIPLLLVRGEQLPLYSRAAYFESADAAFAVILKRSLHVKYYITYERFHAFYHDHEIISVDFSTTNACGLQAKIVKTLDFLNFFEFSIQVLNHRGLII
jgi:hypothetical protein